MTVLVLALAGAAVALSLVVVASLLLSRGHEGTGRRARINHAWREAGWHASGAWADFGDWLRVGR